MNRIFIIILASFISYVNLLAQETFPINGVEDNRENHYAFFNANIVVDYNTTIENGTLIIKNGKIISVGKDANIIVSEGDILDMKSSKIKIAFIKGKRINLKGKQQILYDRFKRKYSE